MKRVNSVFFLSPLFSIILFFCAPNYSYLKRIVYIFGSDPNFYYLLLWEIYTRKLLELNFLLLHRNVEGKGWGVRCKNTVFGVQTSVQRKSSALQKHRPVFETSVKKLGKRRATRGSKSAAAANRELRFVAELGIGTSIPRLGKGQKGGVFACF